MDWKVGLLIILSLVGVYFLGRGITGFMISESCCFGPECSYLCDAAEPHLEAPAQVNGFNMALGSVTLLVGLTFAMHLSSKHRRKV